MATTVPMIAPDGTSGDIPADRAQDAVNAGFKKAVPMTSPDGKTGFIPEERMTDAMKSGFKPNLPDGVKIIGTNPNGMPIYGSVDSNSPAQTVGHFFSSFGDVLSGAAKGLFPSSWGDLAKRTVPGYAQYQMILKPAIEQGSQAIDAAKQGQLSLAAGHTLAAALPVVGPRAAHVGEQLGNQVGMGDYTGAAGTVAGNAALAAGGAMLPKVIPAIGSLTGRAALLGKTPEAAYASSLKPSTVLSPAERGAAIQTGLQNEIPVNAAGLEKLNQLIDNLEQAKTAEINSDPNRPVDPNAVATRVDAAKARFAKQVNAQPDLNAIEGSRKQFLAEQGAQPGKPGTAPTPTGLLDAQGRPLMSQGTPPTAPQPAPPMNASDAQAMKSGTYQVLRGKYGEQGSASVEAQKALARGLKEELNNAFPELENLNAQQSKLLDLQPLLERAVNRLANHQAIGIGTPIAGTAVKAATGSSFLGGGAMLIKSVLDDAAIKSRLAIAVSKASKIPYAQALSRMEGLSTSLGAAAASAPAFQDQSASPQP